MRRLLILLTILGCSSGPGVTTPQTSRDLVIAHLEIVVPTATVIPNDTLTLKVIARNAAGDTVPTGTVAWRSYYPQFGTISSSGLFTAAGAGRASITVTAGGVVAFLTLTVAAPPPAPLVSISIVAPTGQIIVGSSIPLTVHAVDSKGATVTAGQLEWTSSNPDVAAVTAAGVLVGLAPGTSIITASRNNGLKGTTVVTIVALGALDHLVVTGINASLTIGESGLLAATPYTSTGATLPAMATAWRSSNPTVATVSSLGQVAAIGPGTATITASVGTKDASIDVTVRFGNLRIAPNLAPGIALLATGQTVQLSAIVSGSAGQIMPGPFNTIWSSSNSAILSVGLTGLVTAGASGSAQITVSVNGTIATVSFTVAPIGGTGNVRFVNAVYGVNSVTMTSNTVAPVALSFGSSAETLVPSGLFQTSLSGVVGNGQAFTFAQLMLPGTRTILFATGSDDWGGGLLAIQDSHDPVPSDKALVRLINASDYEATYLGNNIYYVPVGAPVSGSALIAEEFGSQSYVDYNPRSGPFDLVIEDAGWIDGQTHQVRPGVEAARFTLTPELGRATTYIITGSSSKSTLRIVTIVDP